MSTITSDHHRPEYEQPYYRKFDLEEVGVNATAFLAHLQPLYETLEWDMYDTARGKLALPTRKRALAETHMHHENDAWNLQRVPLQPYVQPDHHAWNRSEPRMYPEVPLHITDHRDVQTFQKAVADIILSVRNDAQKLRLVLTFLRTVHDGERGGQCALEQGPHKDGADFIISALVVNRSNLDDGSGESSVYTDDGKQVLRAVLQPGEAILQDDRHLQHHITDINRRVQSLPGFRDIFGLDIHILP